MTSYQTNFNTERERKRERERETSQYRIKSLESNLLMILSLFKISNLLKIRKCNSVSDIYLHKLRVQEKR